MKEIRFIIAGGRDYDDYPYLADIVTYIRRRIRKHIPEEKYIECVVTGRAKGADYLGERYADEFGLRVYAFPAAWDEFGNAAGPIRNKKMAMFSKQDGNIGVLIAFWDGKSRGTKSMIDIAKEEGLFVYTVRYTKEEKK